MDKIIIIIKTRSIISKQVQTNSEKKTLNPHENKKLSPTKRDNMEQPKISGKREKHNLNNSRNKPKSKKQVEKEEETRLIRLTRESVAANGYKLLSDPLRCKKGQNGIHFIGYNSMTYEEFCQSDNIGALFTGNDGIAYRADKKSIAALNDEMINVLYTWNGANFILGTFTNPCVKPQQIFEHWYNDQIDKQAAITRALYEINKNCTGKDNPAAIIYASNKLIERKEGIFEITHVDERGTHVQQIDLSKIGQLTEKIEKKLIKPYYGSWYKNTNQGYMKVPITINPNPMNGNMNKIIMYLQDSKSSSKDSYTVQAGTIKDRHRRVYQFKNFPSAYSAIQAAIHIGIDEGVQRCEEQYGDPMTKEKFKYIINEHPVDRLIRLQHFAKKQWPGAKCPLEIVIYKIPNNISTISKYYPNNEGILTVAILQILLTREIAIETFTDGRIVIGANGIEHDNESENDEKEVHNNKNKGTNKNECELNSSQLQPTQGNIGEIRMF